MKSTKMLDAVKRVLSMLLVVVMMMTSFNGAMPVSADSGDAGAEEQTAGAETGEVKVSEPFVMEEEPAAEETGGETVTVEAGGETLTVGAEENSASLTAAAEPAAAGTEGDGTTGDGTTGEGTGTTGGTETGEGETTGGDGGTGETGAGEGGATGTGTETGEGGTTGGDGGTGETGAGEDGATGGGTETGGTGTGDTETTGGDGTTGGGTITETEEPAGATTYTVTFRWGINYDSVDWDATNDDGMTLKYTAPATTQSVNSGAKATAPTETPNPSSAGTDKTFNMTFAGWYALNSDGTYPDEVFDFDTAITADTVLTARWSNTVTYQGGENFSLENLGRDANTYYYDSVLKLPGPGQEETVTRDGYTFDGWYTDENCTEGKEATEIPAGTTGTQTFYAKWTANQVEVIFDYDYTEEGQTEKKVVTDETYTWDMLIEEPAEEERTGYTFDGWYLVTTATGEEGTEKETVADAKFDFEKTTINADITTLRAKWKLSGDNKITVKVGNRTPWEISDGDTIWTNGEAITIEPAEKSPAAAIGMEGDGGAIAEWKGNIVITALGEAEQTKKITFRLNDDANGAGVSSDTMTVTVANDSTAPEISWTIQDKEGNAVSADGAKIVQDGDGYRSGDGFTVILGIKEENFPSDWDNGVTVTINDTTSNTTKMIETVTWTDMTESGNVIGKQATLTDIAVENDYNQHRLTIEVKGVTDAANNQPSGNTTSPVLVYDINPPSVEIERKYNNYHSDSEGLFYSKDEKKLSFTLTIVDENLTLNEDGTPKNTTLKITKNGTEITSTLPKFTRSTEAGKSDTYTATLDLTNLEAGKYNIELTVSDGIHTTPGTCENNVIDAEVPTIDTGSGSQTTPTDGTGSATKQQSITVAYNDPVVAAGVPGSGVEGVYYYITANTGYTTYISKLNVDIGSKENPVKLASGGTGTLTVAIKDDEKAEFQGTVYFLAKDKVGNTSEEQSYAINIDNNGPDLTIAPPQGCTGENYYSKGNVTLELTVKDDNITSADQITVSATKDDDEYTLDTPSWTQQGRNWTATVTIPAGTDGTNDGSYDVALSATDDVGNRNSAIRPGAVVIDTTPVDVSITKNTATETDENAKVDYANHDVEYTLTVSDANLALTGNQPKATVTVTANDEALAAPAEDYTLSSWTQDTSDTTKWTATLTIKALENTASKDYVITLDAEDKAGNHAAQTAQSNKLVIDTTPVDVSITKNTATETDEDAKVDYANHDVEYTLTVSDANLALTGNQPKATVTVTANDEALAAPAEDYTLSSWTQDTSDTTKWTATLTINALENTESQDYVITLDAEDKAGNPAAETAQSDKLVIDTTDPKITIWMPWLWKGMDEDNNFYTNDTYKANSDGHADGVTIQVTDKNIAFANKTFTHGNIRVRVYDSKGNEVSISDAGITFDATKWIAPEDNSDMLQNTINFTVQEGKEFEYYIKVEAIDATRAEFLGKNESDADGNGYSSVVSKDQKDYGLYILDAIKPVVEFDGYTGNSAYPANGDYYQNVKEAVAEGDDYAVYAYNGNGTLAVDVNVTDTYINFDDIPSKGGVSETKCDIAVYRYDTLAAAKDAAAAEDGPTGSPLTENEDYTLSEKWVLNTETANNTWKRTVTITGDEGYYVVYAVATDMAGNNNDPVNNKEHILVNDTTAPKVDEKQENVNGDPGSYKGKKIYYSNDSALQVSFEVSDNNHLDMDTASITVRKYQEDGTASQVTVGEGVISGWIGNDDTFYTASVALGSLEEGLYDICVEVEDLAGNHTIYQSSYYVVDTTKPVVEISEPQGATGGADKNGTYYSSKAVTFDLKVTEANLGSAKNIDVTVKNGESEVKNWTYTKNWTNNDGTWEAEITIPTGEGEVGYDGEYTVTLEATDLAGNGAHHQTGVDENNNPTYTDGPATSAPLAIDTVVPEITISTPKTPTGTDKDNNFYTNGTYDVEIRVTDDHIKFENGDFTLGGIDVKIEAENNIINLGSYTYDPKGWTQEGNILTNTVTFTATAGATKLDEEMYIQVDAHDGTVKNSSSVVSKDQKDYGLYILDAIEPVVKFSGHTGNAVYSGDYYENVAKTAAPENTYASYVYTGSDNSPLRVTIQATDTHIDFDDESSKTKSEISVYRYDTLEDAKADKNGTLLTAGYKLSGWKKPDEADATTWQNTVTIEKESGQGYYVVFASVTDKATNANITVNSSANVLVNDVTAPEVAETQENTTGVTGRHDGKNVYYSSNSDLTASFTVTDNNHLDIGTASITIWKYAVNSGGKNPSQVTVDTSLISEWAGDDAAGHTVDVTLGGLGEGIYTVRLVIKDLAGNQTTYDSDYYVVDTFVPEGAISSKGSGFDNSENPWAAFLNTITFGLFSKNGVTTTLSWEDKSASFLNTDEGVNAAWYWIYEINSGSDTQPLTTADAVNAAAGSDWTAIADLTKNFTFQTGNDAKFVVYLKLRDMAGNETIISSNGMITEDDAPMLNSGDTSNPEVFVTVANQYGNNSGIHAGSARLHVEVTELPNQTFSGIDEVSYTVSASDASPGLSRGGMTYSNTIDGLNGRGDEYIDISIPSGYESDRVILTTTATDKADNTKTVVYNPLNIDNRTPSASVSYDNNTAYNEKYFNQPRTATISVAEMNFDSGNTTVTTTGSVSGWSASGSGSGATSTATVSYTADGDYTLAFQTTDKAGHTLTDSGVTYNGTAAKDFTLDMTKPTATITFQDAEGNTVPSGGYANSTVTATISVVEHNFDESSATRGISITRDGEPYNASVSWINNGDTHIATISFIEEEGAYYTFDMSFVDLANNACDTFQQVSFYVDTMQPAVVVGNIAQNSANNAASIAPVITITDKYYDPNQISITLRGAKNGVISTPYTVSDVENGQQFTFANIEQDDIYTITLSATDLAGNVIDTMYVEMSDETTNELTFSVNREGSTYSVSQELLALLEKYYTNGLAEDLVITIINVDEIEGFTITVSRGLIDSRNLVEGEDYTVKVEEITGGYKYTVTVFKEVFDKDGAYAISVYTEDMAGNMSTNVTADEAHGLELEFYLDTEAPSIVLNNLDKGATYAVSSYEDGSISVSDQTLDEISVVLTYRDGTTDSYVWGSDDINAEDFNGTYVARLNGEKAIKQSSRINIRVTARDKAGNVMEGPYEETENGIELDEDYNIVVSTNAFVRFYANKGLFYGVIGGVLIIIAGIVGVIFGIRKKKEEEEKETETV